MNSSLEMKQEKISSFGQLDQIRLKIFLSNKKRMKQEKWKNTISGSNDKNEIEKEVIENKIIEKGEEWIESEISLDDETIQERVIEKKEEKKPNSLLTILAKTGNINLTLVDEINPVVLLMLQSGIVELTKRGEGQIHGVASFGMKVDHFNPNNQHWEPFLRSISNPREGTLSREGSWSFNVLMNKEITKEIEIVFSAQSALNFNISKSFLSTIIHLKETLGKEEKKEKTQATTKIHQFHEFIVRNETGEDFQFWTTGSNKIKNLSFKQEENEAREMEEHNFWIKR
eukprot:TRINITY_DN1852_c2_g1_i1.p1 TRINITY_DN1852_c2_g1~~TRINITY_DN1852_c2_g1_i1.p1  ORF type:complete len:286 (+),score=106.92 TRINITY_DN1852_c2_g1_i1:477-1334(+)